MGKESQTPAGEPSPVPEPTRTAPPYAVPEREPRTGPPSGTLALFDDQLPMVDPECYEVFGEHARGGLGRVLRAHDVRLDRTVALKELQRRGPEVERRFLREVRITAKLQHPSIVPIHEAGRWPTGEPFYAMKLVEGRSLRDVLKDTPTLAGRLGLLPHVIAVAQAIAF